MNTQKRQFYKVICYLCAKNPTVALSPNKDTLCDDCRRISSGSSIKYKKEFRRLKIEFAKRLGLDINNIDIDNILMNRRLRINKLSFRNGGVDT